MEWQGVQAGEPRLIPGFVFIDERDYTRVYLVRERPARVKQCNGQVGISMQLLALRFALVVSV